MWFASGIGNYIDDRTDAGEYSRVTVETPKHCYLFYNHVPYAFSSDPGSGSILINGKTEVRLELAATIPSGSDVRIGAIVYLRGSDGSLRNEKFWGDDKSLDFCVSEKAESVVLFLRLKGAGEYIIEDFKVRLISLEDYEPLFDEIHHVHEIDSKSATSISVEVDTSSFSDVSNSSIFLATWISEDGKVIPGIPDRAINPKFGPYDYLESNGTTALTLMIPENAHRVILQAIAWKRDVSLFIRRNWKVSFNYGENNTQIEHDSINDLSGIIDSLDDRTPLVVLHTTAPALGHATLSLRPNRLAVEFNRLGCAVIFLPFSTVPEKIEKFDDDVWVICRSLWPSLQLKLADRKTKNNIFVCTSFPNFEAVSAIDFLNAAGWRTAYEVRDDMEEFNRVGYSKWFDPQLEQYVAKRVDYLLAVSPRLASKANIVSGRSDAIVSPNAVSDYLFEQGKENRLLEFQKQKQGTKVVGYLGHLTDSWFDWAAVLESASRLPEYQFRIIGHGFPERLEGKLPSNVSFLGPMTHAEFVLESRIWSVGLIPFKPSPLTFGVDPNKLYEYLALGVRVVSAPMGSVGEAPWTSVYRTVDDLVEAIEFQSSVVPSESAGMELEAYLLKSTWDVRAREMITYLGGMV